MATNIYQSEELQIGIVRKSIFFDKKWYKRQYPDTANFDSAVHFVRHGWREGRNPGPLFSVALYCQANPDVKAANVNPLVHYEISGKKEKRSLGYMSAAYNCIKKSSLFNAKWYLNQYPQAASCGLDPIVHYLIKGWKEGYNPSMRFNTHFYLSSNEDVKKAQVCPLLHYLTNGKKEGRPIAGAQSVKSNRRGIINQLRRSTYRRLYKKQIKNNRNIRIAVHIHLYYADLWDEIKSFLRNLTCYSFDLFITHVDSLPQNILKNIQNFKKDAKIIKVENRGFDLGPFIYFLHQINLDDYQIIYKLHTKRNIKAGNYYGLYMKGSEWRRYLFEGVLDERNVHEVVNTLAAPNSHVGMMASEKLITSVDSTYNREETIRVMEQYGLPTPSEYKCVMGTMFAARASVFHNIKKLVPYDDFTPTKRDVFSLAHAFERILCLNTLAQGKEIRGTRTPYWLSPWRSYQAKQTPHTSVFLPDATMMKNVQFFRKHNHIEERTVTVSSVLQELNPKLYSSLLKIVSINPTQDSPVEENTFTHLVLLGEMVINRKIAEIVSPTEVTVFRKIGTNISVEKKAKGKRFARLKVCDAPETFLLKGTYLIDLIHDSFKRSDFSMKNIVDLLSPCISRAFNFFATANPHLLSPFAWDAIPRNVIINDAGAYDFFDYNIKCLEGVKKYYYIYRVVKDVYLVSSRIGKKLEDNQVQEIYETLCTKFHVSPRYKKAELLEKSLLSTLQRKYTHKKACSEFFLALISVCKWQFHTFGKAPKPCVDTQSIDPCELLKKSRYFDKKYYLRNNPDVQKSGMDPIVHFLKYGWKELRNPSADFDVEFYLNKYRDVRDSGRNPLVHFLLCGKAEGRNAKLSPKMCSNKQYDTIAKSEYFNREWYCETYKLKSHVDPVAHYLVIGADNGYIPSPEFDGNKYWKAYPDIHKARMNPLWHWELAGKHEEARLLFSHENSPMEIKYPKNYQSYQDQRNILLVTHMLNHTGAPILLLDTAKMLRERNYNVFMLSPMDGDLSQDCLEADIPVIICKDCKLFDAAIQGIINFDFYLCNTILTWPSVYQAMEQNIPFIWWIHDNISSRIVFGKLEQTLAKAKDVYVPGDITKSCIEPFSRNVKKLPYLIHDYVDEALPRENNSNRKVIISVLGTISNRKAQDVYVRAIELMPEHIRRKAEFHFIGYASNDDFSLEVCKKIESIPEASLKPVLLSKQAYHEYVDSVDIVCCPSREDPFPLVVIDGFMHAKACVISNRVGQAELITNGVNGYVTPVDDAAALAEALQELIEDEDKLISIQRESRKLFERKFDYKKASNIICNIIEGKCRKSSS